MEAFQHAVHLDLALRSIRYPGPSSQAVGGFLGPIRWKGCAFAIQTWHATASKGAKSHMCVVDARGLCVVASEAAQ